MSLEASKIEEFILNSSLDNKKAKVSIPNQVWVVKLEGIPGFPNSVIVLDTVLGLGVSDDSIYTIKQLEDALAKVSGYSFTVLSAYVRVKYQRKVLEETVFDVWLSGALQEAHDWIYQDRESDVSSKLRTQIGQIPQAELDRWVKINKKEDFINQKRQILDLQEKEEFLVGLRDLLLARAEHLRSLLKYKGEEHKAEEKYY